MKRLNNEEMQKTQGGWFFLALFAVAFGMLLGYNIGEAMKTGWE